MATKRKKQFNLRIAIAAFVIALLLLIIVMLIAAKIQKNNTPEAKLEAENAKYLQERNDQKKLELSEMSEEKRMNQYCADFFRLIDAKNYESAYKLLYSEYKENYFPTLNNFKMYFEEYFPDDFALSYSNFQRMGDIYVLWVSVTDVLNGPKYGHNFSMNVVIKENALNDFVISFSRNSAVDSLEGGV